MLREREEEIVGDLSTGFASTSVQWKIKEFFSIPREINYRMKSPSFDFLGEEWYLTMYSYGNRNSPYTGHVGLYLNNSCANPQMRKINFEMSILNENGKQFYNKNFVADYSVFIHGYGTKQYMYRPQLVRQKAEFGPMGILIVCCHLSAPILGIKEALTTVTREGMDKLSKNFKEFFLSGELSDITLIVQGHQFKCHQIVLAAQSPVFGAMLRLDMQERTTGLVEIEDCEPGAFQQFLTYLYSGSMDEFTEENIFALYHIADKYETPEIKAWCIPMLISGLCLENFCDVVELSLVHNESKLLMSALCFFIKNAKHILLTTSWQNFMKKDPMAANHVYLKASEMNKSHM